MQCSPRCKAKRKDGTPCKAPSLRGATRCMKHGGRVEVPNHPHNVRRFFAGYHAKPANDGGPWPSDRDLWEAMSMTDQHEVLSLVSAQTIKNSARLYLAARLWFEVKDRGCLAEKRFLDVFARA